MNGIVDIAKMLKERDNPQALGVSIGTVVSPMPNIQIRLSDKILLEKENLAISAHVLPGYERTAVVAMLADEPVGNIDAYVSAPPSTRYTVTKMNLQNVPATIEYTDSLKKGDKVILIPTADGQTFYVIDKVVIP